MRNAESSIGMLIKQCDSEIRKAERGKERAEEDVDSEMAKMFSEMKLTSSQDIEDLKIEHRDNLIERKRMKYNQMIYNFKSIKEELSSGYYSLS